MHIDNIFIKCGYVLYLIVWISICVCILQDELFVVQMFLFCFTSCCLLHNFQISTFIQQRILIEHLSSFT